MFNNRRKNGGFTLVEMLMAVAVLAMLSYGLYTLFSRTIKNVDVGDWKARNQLKMRTAMKQLNADISGATFPSKITIGDTVIDKSDKWCLRYKDGSTDLSGFEGPLLEFYICSPERDLPDEKVARKIVKATLTAVKENKHNRLYYQKTLQEGKTDNPNEDNKKTILIDDSSIFDAKVIKAEDSTAYDPNNKIKYVLKLELQARHPTYPKTFHTEHIEIPLMVGYKTM